MGALIGVLAVIAIKVLIAGLTDDKATASTARSSEDGYVDRERSFKSAQVFSTERMGAELRILRREVGATERVRNVTILLDGSMAVYTRRGTRFFWIETDGKTVDREQVGEYPSRLDTDIDLRRVHAITPRKLLMEAEGKFQPRIWKLEALTLAPHPHDPAQLMWTIRWVDPKPFSLYADAAGGQVGREYPPAD